LLPARVAKLVDAWDLKSFGGNPVRVRIPARALVPYRRVTERARLAARLAFSRSSSLPALLLSYSGHARPLSRPQAAPTAPPRAAGAPVQSADGEDVRGVGPPVRPVSRTPAPGHTGPGRDPPIPDRARRRGEAQREQPDPGAERADLPVPGGAESGSRIAGRSGPSQAALPTAGRC
jgi:hypothetical protein